MDIERMKVDLSRFHNHHQSPIVRGVPSWVGGLKITPIHVHIPSPGDYSKKYYLKYLLERRLPLKDNFVELFYEKYKCEASLEDILTGNLAHLVKTYYSKHILGPSILLEIDAHIIHTQMIFHNALLTPNIAANISRIIQVTYIEYIEI